MFRFRLRLHPSYFALASSFLFNRSTKSAPIEIPPPDLPRTPYQHLNCTGFECIRESSMIALTSSSNLLKQTLYYYSELTQRYCLHITTMIGILHEYKKHEGSGHVQQEIWDVFVQQRSTLNDMKKELLRLRLLLTTIDRMVNESIDACYQTQDETVTQLISNELVHSKRIIEQKEEEIVRNERELTEEQVKVIESPIDENALKNLSN
ncbi:unnamed protein product [Adineta ricciae]|uniref:Direct IAP-binding protein with low pI n=1 Tax=Adineta ricciae TaxID=249248 RepID=A0A813UI86_ADIRI|nr:unnamed protein product [Adineta ricciae]